MIYRSTFSIEQQQYKVRKLDMPNCHVSQVQIICHFNFWLDLKKILSCPVKTSIQYTLKLFWDFIFFYINEG